MQSEQYDIPCSVQESPECQSCVNHKNLSCRYDAADLFHFLIFFMPFAITAIGGAIVSGMGVYLWFWLAYAFFFFYIWEANVLCSHCPYWAEPSRVLHCNANYGVIKLVRYKPQPMSRSEQAQFIIGAMVLVLFPVVLLAIARQYLLMCIGIATAVSFGYLLYHDICVKCVNFSCPLNHVPEKFRTAYLLKNPLMKEVLERAGFPAETIGNNQNITTRGAK